MVFQALHGPSAPARRTELCRCFTKRKDGMAGKKISCLRLCS
jgi:hypothetical protein